MEIMYKTDVPQGLFPTKWDLYSGTPKNSKLYMLAIASKSHTIFS